MIVVPKGVVPSLVLNAELNCVGGLEDLRYRDREGEGVSVGAAVDVVQVQTWNILEGAPRVKGDPDQDRLFKGQVSNPNSAREQMLLDGTGLQTNLLGFEPVPQVQVVCSWLDEVQDQTGTIISSFWKMNKREKRSVSMRKHISNYKLG